MSNAGTIQVSGGALSITACAFSNPGSIANGRRHRRFRRQFYRRLVRQRLNTGGTVEIGGTLVNTGTTLVLPGTGTFSNILLSGTLEGGVVQPEGGTHRLRPDISARPCWPAWSMTGRST